MKAYLVVYEKANDGTIWARVPDLSGCYSCGDTIAEAKVNIKEAIELFLETAEAEGITIAEPIHFEAELVEVE